MTQQTSLSRRFGDFCFRQAYAGLGPREIRRKLAASTRESIQRSIAAGITPRASRCEWPWLKQFS